MYSGFFSLVWKKSCYGSKTAQKSQNWSVIINPNSSSVWREDAVWMNSRVSLGNNSLNFLLKRPHQEEKGIKKMVTFIKRHHTSCRINNRSSDASRNDRRKRFYVHCRNKNSLHSTVFSRIRCGFDMNTKYK